jgi:hypothetical protein
MIVRSWQPKRRFRTGALDADVSFRRDVQACGAKNASLVSQLFLCLSRACLVLVKRSFFKKNIYGAKGGVFLTEGAAEGEVNRLLRKANHHNLHTSPYAKTTRFGEDVRPEPVLVK